jgi:integrase
MSTGFSCSNPFRNVLKSGESWSIRVRYEGEKRHRSETFATFELAQARADEIRALHHAERLSADAWRRETTFRQWIERYWWPQRHRHLEAATRRAYSRVYNRRAFPVFGDTSMHLLTQDSTILARFFEELDVKPPTQRKIHTALSAAFTGAVRAGRVERNPCTTIDLLPAPPSRRRRKALSPDQVIAVWQELGADIQEAGRRSVPALHRLRSQVYYSCMVGLGARPSEVSALVWGDVTKNGIVVDKAVKANGVIGPTKTENERTVAAPEWLIADLDGWARANGTDRAHDALIFPGLKGTGQVWKQHSYEHWRRMHWVPAIKRMGARHEDWARYAHVDPYSAGRASHGSISLEAGENPSEVARRLGHRGPATLFAHYDHALQGGVQREIRTTFAAVLGEARASAKLELVQVP